ncbi:MAG: carboxypeptidase regulatory-like domain-containing protein [Cyanobacteria bacterium P01_C01_bin.72]
MALLSIPEKTFAHGANIEYRETSAIAIQAKYDDGTPMANAQVVIYAPSDRANPWLKGVTDSQGNFSFVPERDPENIGNWDVKVRQSGHGDITSIPVNQAGLASISPAHLASAGAAYTLPQKMLMAAAIGWGFIGTALFFARSQSSK